MAPQSSTSTFPVNQVSSDLDFYRYVLPNIQFLGMHIPRITLDKNAPPKIVVVKFSPYHKSKLSDQLNEPFKEYALQYLNNHDHDYDYDHEIGFDSDSGQSSVIGQKKRTIGERIRAIGKKKWSIIRKCCYPTMDRNQTVTFANVYSRRVAGLYRLYNINRIPTVMIIRDGIILVEEFIHSKSELDSFMARHKDGLLSIPENGAPLPDNHDYSNIVQFYQYRGPIVRAIFAFSCVWNSVLHLFGRCIPDVEKFPNGLIGTIIKMLCQMVDYILYMNNNTIDTSRFLDTECPPVSIIQRWDR